CPSSGTWCTWYGTDDACPTAILRHAPRADGNGRGACAARRDDGRRAVGVARARAAGNRTGTGPVRGQRAVCGSVAPAGRGGEGGLLSPVDRRGLECCE